MTRQEREDLIRQHLTALTEQDAWTDFLRTAQKFWHYSLANRLLIWAQMPQATRVAGFHTWKALGRFVKKGQHGLKILAPIIVKTPDPSEPENPDAALPQLKGFRWVTVFDISQTEGNPLLPLDPPLLTTATFTDTLTALIEHSPIPVQFVSPEILPTGANGAYIRATQSIQIRQDLAPDQQLKTLLHEWAHYAGLNESHDETWDRSWEECAAESTAYLIAQSLGLDTAVYSAAYLAGWSHAQPDRLWQLLDIIQHRIDCLTSWIHAAQQTPASALIS
ncbi:ArdC-like ssDNA-binding domain-containing protein [Sulfobacillus thermosulfidooxidans]|uniref:ArdC-like ssDNA-binding domain-containing protein n=1 Tax=Sulfobacillus thermosulfidooxidans TaxID=28034 RepID=UPI0006B5AD1D|nr:ArdC family protein [Sulfobacillus thermosulfidooxidans]